MIKSVDPHGRRVPYPILRPGPGKPHRFVSLSRKLFGVDSHYGNRCTFACPGEQHCNNCKAGDAPRYQGYLIGMSLDYKMTCISHVTAGAAIELNALATPTRGLLGAKILLTRNSVSSNGPVSAIIFGWDDAVDQMPSNTLEAIVNAIYRVKIKGSKRHNNA